MRETARESTVHLLIRDTDYLISHAESKLVDTVHHYCESYIAHARCGQ